MSYPNNLPTFQHLFTFKNNYLVTYLNPLVISTVINEKRDVYYNYLLSLDSILLEYAKGNRSMLGNLLEMNIIDLLSKGGTTFEFNKTIDILKRRNYPNIRSKKYCFNPIPKINTKNYSNFYFLKSFETYIKVTSSDR
jgi:hypothetical protein